MRHDTDCHKAHAQFARCSQHPGHLFDCRVRSTRFSTTKPSLFSVSIDSICSRNVNFSIFRDARQFSEHSLCIKRLFMADKDSSCQYRRRGRQINEIKHRHLPLHHRRENQTPDALIFSKVAERFVNDIEAIGLPFRPTISIPYNAM